MEDVAVYTNLVQKLKELVNLSSLSKFRLFAINNKGNSSNQILRNYWVAKTLMSSHILCKVRNFFKRISLKLFGTSGSNFQR